MGSLWSTDGKTASRSDKCAASLCAYRLPMSGYHFFHIMSFKLFTVAITPIIILLLIGYKNFFLLFATKI